MMSTSERAATVRAAGGWKPVRWLGGTAPGGLALPSGQATADQLYAPRGVWLDDERLVVCDSGNHRILVWRGLPAEDHGPAELVLGQDSFVAEGPAAAGRGPENGLHLPTGVIVAEGRLLVADAWHHRILVWNEVPERSHVPADYAIGQPTLGDVERNRGGAAGSDTLYWPYGVAWIGGRLHVADTGNRRVLIWDGFPEAGEPADIVLGQDDFETVDENRGGPAGPASFRWPHAISGGRDMLFVADAGNHRVLGWEGRPEADRPADVVLGQADFGATWEMPHGPQGPSRLRFPYCLSQCDDALAVADTANNRVLVWRLPIDRERFAPAGAVVGQPNFRANGENHWKAVTAETLCWPYGTCLHRTGNGGLRLAVADSGNNRVMVLECGGAPCA